MLDDYRPSPRTAATASRMLTGSANREPALRATSASRWQEAVRQVEAAVTSGETSTMLRAWQAASVEAQLDRGWQSMAAVGDAALRIGHATGLRFAFGVKARQAYQVALYRSHGAKTVDGVMAAADGFAELGDAEAVAQCISIVLRLGSDQSDAAVAEKIAALRARLTPPA